MKAYENLKEYINFKDKAEFNEHLTAHRQAHCYTLNETDKKLLIYLSRYAIRYTGVAFLKVASMSKFIDKSESTVKRIIRKLEALGIIKRFRNIRKKGGFGANIIQFQRFLFKNERSQVNGRLNENNGSNVSNSKEKSSNNEIKPINFSKQNSLKDYTYTAQLQKGSELTLYQQIKNLVIKQGEDISKVSEYAKILYGSIKIAIKNDNKLSYRHAMKLALESLYCAFNTPLNKITTNRFAFLSGIFKRKLWELYETYTDEELAMRRGNRTEIIPDWFAKQRGIIMPSLENKKVLGRTEIIPDWFAKQRGIIVPSLENKNVFEHTEKISGHYDKQNEQCETYDDIDYEAERARILAKLGRSSSNKE